MVDIQELQSIIVLLDDQDTVVTQCVDDRLAALGDDAIHMLLSMSSSENDPVLKEEMVSRARKVNAELKLEQFKQIAGKRPGPVSLFEGGYLICSMIDPSLRRASFERDFMICSREYMAEASDQRTAVENIRIFNHIFFHRLGFSLYDIQLKETKYMMVSDTLRNRQGNPFVLAFIYMMISQVAGLPINALCFPGGFVPVYMENGKELFYINIYRGGEIFPKDRLNDFLKATGLKIDTSSFKLRDESAMLTLYLESLLFICSNHRDEKKCSVIDRALGYIGGERFLTVDDEEV